jgi:hypothetical protein
VLQLGPVLVKVDRTALTSITVSKLVIQNRKNTAKLDTTDKKNQPLHTHTLPIAERMKKCVSLRRATAFGDQSRSEGARAHHANGLYLELFYRTSQNSVKRKSDSGGFTLHAIG